MKLKDALQPGKPTVLEQLLASSLPTVIYGAGYCARSIADALLAEGKPAVCCTVDRRWINSPSRCPDLPLVPLDELHKSIPKCNIAVAIGTARPKWDLLSGIKGVHNVFGNIGLARGLPMNRNFIDEHRGEIEFLEQKLGDGQSKLALSDYLRSRLFGHTDDLPTIHFDNGWFHSVKMHLTEDDVYCDCGAYDGDTLQLFADAIPNFKRAYAWEPDHANVELLSQRIQTQKIANTSIIAMCAASFRGQLRFSAESASVSAASDTGTSFVPCDRVDQLCPDTSVIKVDVEGAELDVLAGAAETLSRQATAAIVAGYHRRDDLLTLSKTLRERNEETILYLRWMRPAPDDVLLFSVPPGRHKH
jgi:FkbM family methyltransferase